jgi:hypothetical protein
MAVVVPSYKGFRFPVEIISHCVWGTVNLVACLVAGRIVGLLAARWEGLA